MTYLLEEIIINVPKDDLFYIGTCVRTFQSRMNAHTYLPKKDDVMFLTRENGPKSNYSQNFAHRTYIRS